MLVDLTNDAGRASSGNKNFVREVLELHSLGPLAYLPGVGDRMALGHRDKDVWEFARAFTGWTMGDGRWVADGATTPRTGQSA